jgi:hypothetical protein
MMWACSGHENKEEAGQEADAHEAMAQQLSPVLQKMLGWQ